MAIRIMKKNSETLNAAIDASCEMIYNIEDLLNKGPKQLEAYETLLRVLKDMKRGVPIKETLKTNAIQGCPPGAYPTEHCEAITCQTCWEEYVQAYVDKINEKEKSK